MFQEHEQNKEVDGTGLANISRRTGTISVPGMASLPVVAQSSLPVKVVAPTLQEYRTAEARAKVKAEAKRRRQKERKEAVADFLHKVTAPRKATFTVD